MTVVTARLSDADLVSESERLRPLLSAEGAQALLLHLAEEEAVGPCRMSQTVLYLVLSGQGRLRVESDEVDLQQGTLALVPRDAERTLKAADPMRVLAVQMP